MCCCKLHQYVISILFGTLNNIHKEFFKFLANCFALISERNKIISVYGKTLGGPAFTAFYNLPKDRAEIVFVYCLGNKGSINAYILSVGGQKPFPGFHIVRQSLSKNLAYRISHFDCMAFEMKILKKTSGGVDDIIFFQCIA